MVQGEALPAQDGHLMSQGDEFELRRGAARLRTRNESREPRADKSVSMLTTV